MLQVQSTTLLEIMFSLVSGVARRKKNTAVHDHKPMLPKKKNMLHNLEKQKRSLFRAFRLFFRLSKPGAALHREALLPPAGIYV